MTLYGTGSNPKTELLINGTWTDVSDRPRGAQKIVMTRGRANEQSQVAAQTASSTIDNTDGVMSNRNPNSPYFGLLPRNTQVRHSAGTGDTYVKAVYSDTTNVNNVSTADKAVLDIVGDLDVRCDVLPYSWRARYSMVLASKANSGTNLSWFFYLNKQGFLGFFWTTGGSTATQHAVLSTVAVPATSGRLTVRAAMDVDNGASGNTVTFSTSDSVTGTFTTLGAPVVSAGITSIFSGSAALLFAGGLENFQQAATNVWGFGGRMYRGQVYSGIAGTLRADMNPMTQTIGTTQWSDGLGTPNTWNVGLGPVRITSDRVRFLGELSSLPQQWDPTGTDVYAPVTASGMIRRLTQGASPVNSPMYRNFSRRNPNGYWSLETSAGSQTANGKTGVATLVDFGVADNTLPGAASIAQFTDAASALSFTANKATSTGTVSHVFYLSTTLPATQKVVARLYSSGSIRTVRVSLSATQWIFEFVAADGTVFTTVGVIVTGIDPSQSWVGVNVLMQQSGSDVAYSIRWDALNDPLGGVGIGPTTITGATCGVPIGALFTATDIAFTTAKYSSVFMSTGNFDLTDPSFRNASSAWLNETAGDRLNRVAAEENQAVEIWGVVAESEPMGPQPIGSFMDIVYDCAATDGGMLGECRDLLSLLYRTRTSLEGRGDVRFLYDSSHLSQVPTPTDDDQAFTNDVTVTNTDGGSARAVNTDGPTSTSQPPVGVGVYATSVARNVATDDRLPSVAGWAMITGSWDDQRYPNLTIGMHRTEVLGNATLFMQVAALEIGDTATLANMPSWQPPDDVLELIQGYTETLDKFTWEIVLNCTPGAPYAQQPVLGSDTAQPRLDATGHTIGTLTTIATSVSLVTPAGSALWVTTAANPTEFPFNVKMAGEVVTLTAITGTSSPQTGTITRSVNGIVKSHPVAGELVRLAIPYYIGR